jgi:hypothetical protein
MRITARKSNIEKMKIIYSSQTPIEYDQDVANVLFEKKEVNSTNNTAIESNCLIRINPSFLDLMFNFIY